MRTAVRQSTAWGLSLPQPPRWTTQASCRNYPYHWWDRNNNSSGLTYRDLLAADICRRCPVRAECDDWARTTHAYGVIMAGYLWPKRRPIPPPRSPHCRWKHCGRTLPLNGSYKRSYCCTSHNDLDRRADKRTGRAHKQPAGQEDATVTKPQIPKKPTAKAART